MKILVACEESQRVCIEFRKKGHEAYSCDIIECSGGHPEWHIKQDALPLLDGNCKFMTCDGLAHSVDGKWDMIIAHPPCTYLSNAGACRLYPHKGQLNIERYEKGLEGKEFFMSCYNADCDKVVVENPVPSKIFNLPVCTQSIHPHQFYGINHPYTKKTCLWEKGVSKLVPTKSVPPISPFCPSGTGRKNKSKYGAAKRGNDALERSKTFYGVARAMAEQWG